MLEQLKQTANKTYTENGAVTYASSMSDCLDFFARIGGMRFADDKEIIDVFIRAYMENADLAMKLLFYSRDIRGGLGERRIFRLIINWLAKSPHSSSVSKNIRYIPEYGRYDDLLVLLGTSCEGESVELIKNQLEADERAAENGEGVSLLAKWLPSVNATNETTVKTAKYLAQLLGFNDAIYRKKLSRLRSCEKIIENNLRERDYTFDYSKQPSKAMLKYRAAFLRNDNERYTEYIKAVSKGEAKLNTGTLAPYEIIAPLNRKIMNEDEVAAIDATWNALENFTNGENALAVVDGSGSMYWGPNPVKPIEVAISLGIYFAERNTGIFRNHFITFSENPRLVEIKGKTIADKAAYCSSFNEIANTNIQRVFELILQTALANKLPRSQLPTTLYIISDMEFDYCTRDSSLTNFEYAKRLYEQNGYKLPQIVFWNVNSRNSNLPVMKNEQGAVLVSGCSPRIFSMVKSRSYDPYSFMLEAVNSGRYDDITA